MFGRTGTPLKGGFHRSGNVRQQLTFSGLCRPLYGFFASLNRSLGAAQHSLVGELHTPYCGIWFYGVTYLFISEQKIYASAQAFLPNKA